MAWWERVPCCHCRRTDDAHLVDHRTDEVGTKLCPDCDALYGAFMKEHQAMRDRTLRHPMHPCGCPRTHWTLRDPGLPDPSRHIRNCPHPGCMAEWRRYRDAVVGYCGVDAFKETT